VLFIVFVSALLLAQPADGVNVTTDSSSYQQGAPIEVTIVHAGPDRITRGGLACDDVWPLALEELDADGTWQPVPVAPRQCIGIAAVVVSPGQSQTKTLTLPLEVGSYHLVYGFDDIDNGTYEVATSDPFDIVAPRGDP